MQGGSDARLDEKRGSMKKISANTYLEDQCKDPEFAVDCTIKRKKDQPFRLTL